jgi:GlpG protein
MTDFHTALQVNLNEDLLPLSALLHQRGIAHRVYEEGGRQVLKVEVAEHVADVQALYQSWRKGDLKIELSRRKSKNLAGHLSGSSASAWQRAPITLLFVALSICGFLLMWLPDGRPYQALFTFLPFQFAAGQLTFGSMDGQYWRLVTPMFLHFGWLHIVFNCLWLWDLGPRIEQVIGHFNTFMLFLAIAVVSNISQFQFAEPGIFGGMSGVVYGLLGFAWVGPLVQPAWRIQPSPAIMLFMVGWLVACMIGLVEVLGFGKVANSAHLGGLICGALLGLIFGSMSRFSGDKGTQPQL